MSHRSLRSVLPINTFRRNFNNNVVACTLNFTAARAGDQGLSGRDSAYYQVFWTDLHRASAPRSGANWLTEIYNTHLNRDLLPFPQY